MNEKRKIHVKGGFSIARALPIEGWEENAFFTSDNDKIRYGQAHLPKSQARGTIIVTTGYGEHIDLYGEVIEHYMAMGLNVVALDWHGHGLSGRDNPNDPRKPSARGMNRHVKHLHEFLENVVKHDPASGPLLLSSHSMGGAVSLRYMQQYPNDFDGAVITSPLLDIYRLNLPETVRPFIRDVFRMASDFGLGKIHMLRLDNVRKNIGEKASKVLDAFVPRKNTPRNARNQTIREKLYQAQLDMPTVDWIKGTFSVTDELMKEENLRSIRTPVLLGSAENDDFVSNEAHSKAAVLNPLITRIMLKNSGHGIWFEQDSVFYKWMDQVSDFVDEVVKSYHNKKASPGNDNPPPTNGPRSHPDLS